MLTVENSSDWLGREASSPRQKCRDDCVNVKLFVKLFVITGAARRGQAESGDVVMVSAVILDQIRPDPRTRGQSPKYRVIITRLIHCLQAASLARSRGSRKGRGFYAQVIMFSTDCFLVLEKLNIVFHNDFAAALNNQTTGPMNTIP